MEIDASREIQPELGPHERLLWADRPVQGIKFRWWDAVIIPAALYFAGQQGYYIYLAMHGIAPPLRHYDSHPYYALFGAVGVVLFLLFYGIVRIFLEARSRTSTFYGLTDQRVLMISGRSARSVKSLPLHGFSATLSEFGGGRGIIMFDGAASPGDTVSPQFDIIAEAAEVCRKIRAAQEEAKAAGDPRDA